MSLLHYALFAVIVLSKNQVVKSTGQNQTETEALVLRYRGDVRGDIIQEILLTNGYLSNKCVLSHFSSLAVMKGHIILQHKLPYDVGHIV